MGKQWLIFVLFIFLILTACDNQPVKNDSDLETNQKKVQYTATDSINSAHFQGIILEVKRSSIIVGTDDVDPESSYPAYEVLIDDSTEVSGKVEEFSGLKEQQKVKIWVIDKGPNNEIDNKVATRILVEQ